MTPPFVSETTLGRPVDGYGVATAAFFGYPSGECEESAKLTTILCKHSHDGRKTETASEHEESNELTAAKSALHNHVHYSAKR